MRTFILPRPWWIALVSLFGILFGVLTLKEGGSVLFIDGEARRAAGEYVPFVLWFNFITGFAYILAAVGLWLQRRWSIWLAFLVAGATLVVFAAFGVHVYLEGAFESRTVIAMTLRTLIWLTIAVVAWRWQAPYDASNTQARQDEDPPSAPPSQGNVPSRGGKR